MHRSGNRERNTVDKNPRKQCSVIDQMNEKQKKNAAAGTGFPINGMGLLGTPNDQAPNHTAIKTTRHLVTIPRMAALHKCLPSFSTTCHANPKKRNKEAKDIIFNPPFLPEQNSRIKRGAL